MKKGKKIYRGYIITNTINDKQYVGITSHSVLRRWAIHKQDARFTKSEYRNHFHNAINKYDPINFKIETIKKAKSWEEVCQWEIQTIKALNTKNPEKGYNLTDGGEGCPGIKRTELFKQKLSKIKKEYYKDPIKRKEQSKISKRTWKNPDQLIKASMTSKKLWKDAQYRKKTIQNNKKRWEDAEMKEKHKQALIKATALNPEWLERNKKRNRLMAKDPEWRDKVSKGLKKAYQNPEARKRQADQTKAYWQEGHETRRNNHAKTMSKMINLKLKNPEYQKWRKENPPNGKPIQYRFKYFRSTSEACRFFKVSSPKISKDILKKVPGCCKLNPTKSYKFEIQYNELY